ncbi:RNA polymerase binding [Proteus phage phiP4-3]|uniref:RNA polymerase binding protein n=1 Tax=Proteus phage phiP4-3 TaxID=2065203 RepID=A0A2I6PFR3_9CAUD|nr:RNA polymerase binding [Proteus phage phiP4-3]AUM58579.1 RNA polymerase binding protein [Proteus phage phiP4-3]AZV01181.1 RNA polymerase binding protein [Shigella phage vB_SdyM_006]
MIKETKLKDKDFKNAIRQAWVSQLPEKHKTKFLSLPKEQRFSLYKDLDSKVSKEYVQWLKDYKTTAIANGAKLIPGTDILEEKYQIDTSDVLLKAASIVIKNLK